MAVQFCGIPESLGLYIALLPGDLLPEATWMCVFLICRLVGKQLKFFVFVCKGKSSTTFRSGANGGGRETSALQRYI